MTDSNNDRGRTRNVLFMHAVVMLTLLGTVSLNARNYDELKKQFQKPDHATWGEVPLWWWEGAPMTRGMVTAELEELASKGVKAVCPIQRSPGRCDPASFTPEWWEMLAHVHKECRRLGMKLWVYDQVGYGHYGWLEKAAATLPENNTLRVAFVQAAAEGGKEAQLALPEDGHVLFARAYPVENNTRSDAHSIDLTKKVQAHTLTWTPPEGTWAITAATAVPSPSFYLNADAADAFIEMLYGKIEKTVGAEAMGKSFYGVFQDEHPPTPRDLYTEELALAFEREHGYPLVRAIPALHLDIGPHTQKYRTDFFDTYLSLVEHTYWKRVFDWSEERSILTSHDNWGRNNIYRQSEGYIDYFRTQRWFSSPGYDDAGQRPLTQRNYYDTKIASSIARLYSRKRVWNEAFHSSGWGRTTDQTLSWLTTGMAFGANLYDEHGLYYDTRASTWEHAAPDPHWRQPYWRYYQTLSDYVARSSFLMSQGTHVVDAAVHYPVVSLLAGALPSVQNPDYNLYMRLSRKIFDAGIDNDIIDDDSIIDSRIADGKLFTGGNGYRALVFGPETTVRRAVLQKAYELVRSGGTVLFYQKLPQASTEAGRDDPKLALLLTKILGISMLPETAKYTVTKKFKGDGFSAFIPAGPSLLPEFITEHVERDFLSPGEDVFVTHRKTGAVDIYLVQNKKKERVTLKGRFRTRGVPELWDAFTGDISPVQAFHKHNQFVAVEHTLEGNTGYFFIFHPGKMPAGGASFPQIQPEPKPLPETWEFSVIPTRNNRWGEFRRPPSAQVIGPEVRTFRYHDGQAAGKWHAPDFNDSSWETCLYSTGPYWLYASDVKPAADITKAVLESSDGISEGIVLELPGQSVAWRALTFSKTIGAARAAPWGGHSGYPDGHIDKNFVHLPQGRKLLFTRIRSHQEQRLGLRVELRNSTPKLWVNGTRQPFEDAVGNLPLRKGENTVLLDLPDGGHGRLFVQKTPPSATSMEEAARGSVAPDMKAASWIWYGDGNACYTRKTFELDELPRQARCMISAFSGYRLFINGKRIAEEIGPWANWRRPERFSVTPHLQKGKNVIAVWGQLFAGQNVNKGEQAFRSRGIVAALALRFYSGEEKQILTDGTWQGTAEEYEDWAEADFDASNWNPVKVQGEMGDAPWGMEVVNNAGPVTEPARPLSIHLDSPYLTCFDEVTDIVYDVKKESAARVGCYRFRAPPGLRSFTLPKGSRAEVWIDGIPAEVNGNTVQITAPPRNVSLVAIRMIMKPGAYAGAAFPVPIPLTLGGGEIQPGPWSDYALPTYSGIGVYKQTIPLTGEELTGNLFIDLGDVASAAELLVNGKQAGVRLARPFKFTITDLVKAGDNTLQVRIANTIAPHYTTIPAMNLGPTTSGLLGPVVLKRTLTGENWQKWADEKLKELDTRLKTETDAIREERRRWEKQAGWKEAAGGLSPVENKENTYKGTVPIDENLKKVTGIRFSFPAQSEEEGASCIEKLEVNAVPDKDNRLMGRFVRIEMIDRPEYLALAEVEVFSGRDNIASEGTARQSSTSFGGHARLAIDGNTDGLFQHGSVTHTNPQPIPWWELDMGGERPVDRVRIWNRMDQDLYTRLQGFRVAVLDAKRKVLWEKKITDVFQPDLELYIAGPVPLALKRVEQATPSPGTAVFSASIPQHITSGKLSFSLALNRPVEAPTLSVTRSIQPVCDLPPSIEQSIDVPQEKRTEKQEETLRDFYLSVTPLLAEERQKYRTIKKLIQRQ